jgi:hypothetical protein
VTVALSARAGSVKEGQPAAGLKGLKRTAAVFAQQLAEIKK